MKKQLFTLLMLVAMVALGSKAMAANNDKWTPYAGSTQSYTITGLESGNTHELLVTNSTTQPSSGTADAAVEVAVADFDNVNADANYAYLGALTGSTSITEDINWGSGASGDYYLWIISKSTTSCYNYRYKKITVTAYIVDFVVYAFNEDSSFVGDTPAAGNTRTAECQNPLSPVYDMDGTPSNGDVTMYFKVSRKAVDASAVSDWKFNATLTFSDGTITPSERKYGTSTSSMTTDWTSGGLLTISSGSEDVYFKVTVPAQTSAFTAKLEITNAEDSNGMSDNDDANVTIAAANSAINSFNAVPSIGTFQ